MRTELVIRFDYGSVIPWLFRPDSSALVAIGGPDGLVLRTPIDLEPEGMTHTAEFTVRAGERVPFVLTWFPSHEARPEPVDAEDALADTETFWRDWLRDCAYEGGVRACGAHVAHRAEGTDLPADRWDRRRADHLAAGARSAECATGTTATAGCAMRRSRSTR